MNRLAKTAWHRKASKPVTVWMAALVLISLVHWALSFILLISKERTYYVSEFKKVKKIIINRNDMCYIRYCWLWF